MTRGPEHVRMSKALAAHLQALGPLSTVARALILVGMRATDEPVLAYRQEIATLLGADLPPALLATLRTMLDDLLRPAMSGPPGRPDPTGPVARLYVGGPCPHPADGGRTDSGPGDVCG